MTRRLIAACLIVTVLCTSMAAPVSAAEDDSVWVELLETETVDDSGSNAFSYSTKAIISIPTPMELRCSDVEMLITYIPGTVPDSVQFLARGEYRNLTILEIVPGLARIYGGTPAYYFDELQFVFNRNSTNQTSVQILSCRIRSVARQHFEASGQVYMYNTYYPFSTYIEYPGIETANHNVNSTTQIRIDVTDWAKYDMLTIWGTADYVALQSIQATIDVVGLPITVSYMSNIETNEWTDWTVDASGDTGAAVSMPHYNGKIFYCIEIDVSEVDPALSDNPLHLYMTGVFQAYSGFIFNCEYVNGSIIVADTSGASWWTKFTTFMTELFSPDSPEADDFSSEMESQGAVMDDMVGQMDTVEKPDIEDVNVDAGAYVDSEAMATTGQVMNEFMMNEMVLTMLLIAASVGLGAFIVF